MVILEEKNMNCGVFKKKTKNQKKNSCQDFISINFIPYLTEMEINHHCGNKERLHFVQMCDIVIISSVRTHFINVKYDKYNNY